MLLSSRQTAIAVHKMLANNNSNGNGDGNDPDEETLKKFGPDSQVRLLSDLKLSEVEAVEMEVEKYQDKLKEANYIVDAEKARQLINMILQVRCPVVMEFHQVFYVLPSYESNGWVNFFMLLRFGPRNHDACLFCPHLQF